MFRIKKQQIISFIFIIGCMSHSEKVETSCYIAKYRLLRLDNEDKNWFRIRKLLKTVFDHMRYESPEEAISSCFIENYRLLSLDLRRKVLFNQKTTLENFNLHHRMYESPRKSYSIMQFWKLSNCET